MRLFNHMDKLSKDNRVFLEEYLQAVQTLPMLNIWTAFTAQDFRRIKDRDNGYFTRQQFVDYCWRESKLTLKGRERELEEL